MSRISEEPSTVNFCFLGGGRPLKLPRSRGCFASGEVTPRSRPAALLILRGKIWADRRSRLYPPTTRPWPVGRLSPASAPLRSCLFARWLGALRPALRTRWHLRIATCSLRPTLHFVRPSLRAPCTQVPWGECASSAAGPSQLTAEGRFAHTMALPCANHHLGARP